jgi:hypothetical protein
MLHDYALFEKLLHSRSSSESDTQVAVKVIEYPQVNPF